MVILILEVAIRTVADSTSGNNVNMVVNIDKRHKIKIKKLCLEATKSFPDKKLRKP
jgi:outer membrane protein insertion porin family